MIKSILIACISAFLLLIGSCESKDNTNNSNVKELNDEKQPNNMVWIPGGEFTQGATISGEYRREYPAHKSRVNSFWMDKTEVTNSQFSEFTKATNYTTTAERDVDWEQIKTQVAPGTPKPADSILQAGSLIFLPPNHKVPLNDINQWWKWKIGANWRHPDGPDSDIVDRMNHPVVHVAYEDALAYCKWSGKRLPTEAEWEYASRGGVENTRFAWGNLDPIKNNSSRIQLTNIWQGEFPYVNTLEDGYYGTAPAGQYPPNNFGLYDMAGNVWELCSDLYAVNYYDQIKGITLCENPKGPDKSWNPQEPYTIERVHKGGSYLCHVSYCENYRNSAREGISEDTGMRHLGFRCVKD